MNTNLNNNENLEEKNINLKDNLNHNLSVKDVKLDNNYVDNIIESFFSNNKFESSDTDDYFNNLLQYLKDADLYIDENISYMSNINKKNQKDIILNKDTFKEKLDLITVLFNNYELRVDALNQSYSEKLGYSYLLSKEIQEYENLNNNIDFAIKVFNNIDFLNTCNELSQSNNNSFKLPDIFTDINKLIDEGIEIYEAIKSIYYTYIINKKKDYNLFVKNYNYLETKITDNIEKSIKEYYENQNYDKLEKLFSFTENYSSDSIIETYCNFIIENSGLNFKLKSVKSIKFEDIDNFNNVIKTEYNQQNTNNINLSNNYSPMKLNNNNKRNKYSNSNNVNDSMLNEVKKNILSFHESIVKECNIQFGSLSGKIFLLFPQSKYNIAISNFFHSVLNLILDIRKYIENENDKSVDTYLKLAEFIIEETNVFTKEIKKIITNISNNAANNDNALSYVDIEKENKCDNNNFKYNNKKNNLNLISRLDQDTDLFIRGIEGTYIRKEEEFYTEHIIKQINLNLTDPIRRLKFCFTEDLKKIESNKEYKSLSEAEKQARYSNLLTVFYQNIFEIIKKTNFSFLCRGVEDILIRIVKIIKTKKDKDDMLSNCIIDIITSLKNALILFCDSLEFIIDQSNKFNSIFLHYYDSNIINIKENNCFRLTYDYYFVFARINIILEDFKYIFTQEKKSVLREYTLYNFSNFVDEIDILVHKEHTSINQRISSLYLKIQSKLVSEINLVLNRISVKDMYKSKKILVQTNNISKEFVLLIDIINDLFKESIISWPGDYKSMICLVVTNTIKLKMIDILKGGCISENGAKVMKIDFAYVYEYFKNNLDNCYSDKIKYIMSLVDIYFISKEDNNQFTNELLKELKDKLDDNTIKIVSKKRMELNY